MNTGGIGPAGVSPGTEKEAPPPSGGTVWIVEDLRGIASLAVVLFHLRTVLPRGVLRDLLWNGQFGVESFFVISGFVMPLALTRSGYSLARFPRFLLKRVVRLDPPYAISLVLALLVHAVSTHVPGFRGAPFVFDGARVSSHALYLTGFLGMDWIQPVYWTLALEFQYYIALGLLFPILWKPEAWRFLLLSAICLSGPFLAEGKVTLLPFLPYFGLGFAALRFREGILSRPLVVTVGVLLAAASFQARGPVAAGVAVASALAIVLIRSRGRMLGWLGGISYSLYLVHVPIGARVAHYAARYAESGAGKWGAFLLGVGVSLAAAGLMFRFVEKPARSWAASLSYVRGRGTKPRGVAEEGAAP